MNHENAHYTEEKMIFGKGVLCHKVTEQRVTPTNFTKNVVMLG